jgi:hypothetical protein
MTRPPKGEPTVFAVGMSMVVLKDDTSVMRPWGDNSYCASVTIEGRAKVDGTPCSRDMFPFVDHPQSHLDGIPSALDRTKNIVVNILKDI